jgi:hypothetical protein
MTDDDFRDLAPCFARYLLPYRRYVGEIRCAYNVVRRQSLSPFSGN